MLVRFSSAATEPITMFGDIAIQLIKGLGASGRIPGAIRPEDIPAAVQRLRQHLITSAEPHTDRSETMEGRGEEKDDAPVALATRAAPLIGLLERAAVADAPVMWDAA